MSNTKWRISGGLGEPDLPAQVMTQGLGFPLRPVDNVPPQDSGEEFDGVPIAEGLFLQWMGPYQSGLVYPAGSMVTDGPWTMVALVTTVTKPAPQPEGNPTFGLPDVPAFVTQDNLSVVYSGHTYTFNTSGWIRELRVWAPELTVDTNYRVVIVNITDPNKPVTTIIDNPVLTEDAWKSVAFGDTLILAGTVLRVYLDALNSGADAVVAGGWDYYGAEQNLEPPQAGWNHSNQHDLLRIDKTDLDSTDRTSELLGMIPGTTITFAETSETNRSFTYRVIGAPVELVTSVAYSVELTSSGPLGGPLLGETTTMTAAVPIAQATEYAEIVGSVPTPTWATVEGFLEFDGATQGGELNSYGVDLQFDAAIVNTAWQIVAYAGD